MAEPGVRPGQWHDPAAADGSSADQGRLVLAALSDALSLPPRERGRLVVERQRLAGRSDIHVVAHLGSPVSSDGWAGRRWVVKKPNPGWHLEDDIADPLTAEEELGALSRLHRHFEALDGPFRVPEPVGGLPSIDAYAMEHVQGVTIKDLLGQGSLGRPRLLAAAVASAGALLRQLHALEDLPPVEVELHTVARSVLALADERLPAAGLELPAVVRSLSEVPPIVVPSRRVWLHGDFGPGNLVLAEDGSTVLLDPSLSTVGAPEEDLARFLTLMSGVIRFAPGVVAPPVAALRRRLEREFLRGYFGSTERPALLELTVIGFLVHRWCRLRALTELHNRNALMPVRLRVIDAQVRQLLVESARRLDREVSAAAATRAPLV